MTAGLYFNGIGVYVLGSDYMGSMPVQVTVDDATFSPIRGNNSANQLNFVPIFGLSNLDPNVQHLIIIKTIDGSGDSGLSSTDGSSISATTFQLDGFM